jgi:hypothetical protein
MDTPVERDLTALRTIVAALIAMAGVSRATLPRHLYRTLVWLMRPAEAAVRRLVIVLARDVVLRASDLRSSSGQQSAQKRARRRFALTVPLIDPLKRFGRARPSRLAVPRISMPGVTTPFPIAPRHVPQPHDPINAARLFARLDALQRVLQNPGPLAARMARWQVRQRLPLDAPAGKKAPRRFSSQRVSPLRPGHPPGYFPSSRRAADRHKVHDLLEHAQGLAHYALSRPDTS